MNDKKTNIQKILITGGSGFVGTSLASFLIEQKFIVVATGTSPTHFLNDHPDFRYISADTTQPGKWQDQVQDADIIINLAGRTIFHLWSKEYKKQIYQSRILTTRNLVDAMPDTGKSILCSASAAGFYGNQADTILTEQMKPGDDFLAKVCIDWEKEAIRAKGKGARVVSMRFGVILGPNGGAIQKMVPAYSLFVGGPLGSGAQWFPWIHIQDLLDAIAFIIKDPNIQGPVNFTAPGTVQNRTFSKAMGKALNRPSFFKTPGFIIKMAAGELGETFLASQRVVPEKLKQHGFQFTFPTIEEALTNISQSKH